MPFLSYTFLYFFFFIGCPMDSALCHIEAKSFVNYCFFFLISVSLFCNIYHVYFIPFLSYTFLYCNIYHVYFMTFLSYTYFSFFFFISFYFVTYITCILCLFYLTRFYISSSLLVAPWIRPCAISKQRASLITVSSS